ncbi:MAG: RagB/SusD family nutrient uptake outer membrane protein [Tannerella sp.]|nr:RagB/SusD family nutrient uptake outer membrane protein [Tannerella sp.]
MKKIIFQLGIITLCSCLLMSCEDVMDKKNLESLVADDIWQDPVLLKGYMDNVMANYLPGTSSLDGATEETYGQYSNDIPYDNVPISIGGTSNVGAGQAEQWHYAIIRAINRFLDNADKCPEAKLPTATLNDYKAQMLFLRAWYYFIMVRTYGGVPLILNEQRLDEELSVPREKTSVCIAQIIKDLDDAINYGDDFPFKRDDANAGRINRAAALVFKARVLLYYASPQFASQTPAGTKSAEQRWQEAYAACKRAIDELNAAGFGLFRPNPASPEEAVQNYKDMFSEDNEYPDNPEMIWVKRYQYPQRTSFAGTTMGGPTLELVNAFAKADGTPYTDLHIPEAGSTAMSLGTFNVPYWIGREPRFYAWVVCNGNEYPIHVNNPNELDLDEEGRMKHYYIFIGGQAPYADCSRMEHIGSQWVKMADNKINNTIAGGNHCGMDYPLMRYAEALLNLAECAAKTNRESEARDILYQIRRRAGIPQGSNNYGIGSPSGEELMLAIIKERRIELAMEGFRFWDLRRWRLFTDPIAGYRVNGTVRHTIKGQLKGPLDPAAFAALDIMKSPDDYFKLFDNQIWALDASPFSVTERQYFYRIDYDLHIRKNPIIEQTALWDNGTFDPYQ